MEGWEAIGPEKRAVVTRFGWEYYEMKDWVRKLHNKFPIAIRIRAAAMIAAFSPNLGSTNVDAFAPMFIKAMDCILRVRAFEFDGVNGGGRPKMKTQDEDPTKEPPL